MNKIALLTIFLFQTVFLSKTLVAQVMPENVAAALAQTKTNKEELEKVIQHFRNSPDSLKLEAAYFLIANMDIHRSQSYYWADSVGNKIPFNELSYPDFSSAIQAFDNTKKNYQGIHPVSYSFRDIDSVKADYLISNIEEAFLLWKKPLAKNISFENFCEYLLPYRVSIEPLQDWRNTYEQRFKNDCLTPNTDSSLVHIKKDITRWFTCTYNLEKRTDPIPRLGALQLLLRKKGPCEDVADLVTYSLRSQGIPSSIDYVPAWATSSGNHTLNVAFGSAGEKIHYDVLTSDSIKDFIREPAKVLRSTYSRQKNTLANFEIAKNIPEGFLRQSNYIDVTSEYWQTRNVICKVSNSEDKPIAYSAVFNHGHWQPAWWGFVRNDSVLFTNMCQGAVILPMYYINGKLLPAGYPVASGYDATTTLIPDTLNRTTLILKEQRGYLRFRPGKRYKLYYWNNKWKLIGEKNTDAKTTQLVFANVPKNALYILVPEYTQKKERPFTVNDKGERNWW